MEDRSRGVDDEFRRLDDSASFLPPRTEPVRLGARQSEGDRERKLGRDLLRLVLPIDAGGNDHDAECRKFIVPVCEAAQLTAAESSPMTAVEQNEGNIGPKVVRQRRARAIRKLQRHARKRIAGVQLLSHRAPHFSSRSG